MSTAFVLTRKKDIDVYKSITQQYQRYVEPSADLLPKLFTYTQETKRSWFRTKNQLAPAETIHAADLDRDHYLTPASGALQRPFYSDIKCIITEGALYAEYREHSWWRRRGRQAYKNCLDPRYILLCYFFHFLEDLSIESTCINNALLTKIDKNKKFILEIIQNSDAYFSSRTGSHFKKFLVNFKKKLDQLEKKIQKRYYEQSLAEQLENNNNQFAALIDEFKYYRTLMIAHQSLSKNFAINPSVCDTPFIHHLETLNQWLNKLLQSMKWEGQSALLSDDELSLALEAGISLWRQSLNKLTDLLINSSDDFNGDVEYAKPKKSVLNYFGIRPGFKTQITSANFAALESRKQTILDFIGNLQAQLGCFEAALDSLKNQDGHHHGVLTGHELLISLKQHIDLFTLHGFISSQTHTHWHKKLTQTPAINPDDLLASFKIIEDSHQSTISRQLLLDQWMNFLIKKHYILHYNYKSKNLSRQVNKIYNNYLNFKNQNQNQNIELDQYVIKLKSDFKSAANSSSYRCLGIFRVRDKTTHAFYQELAKL